MVANSNNIALPYAYASGAELLAICAAENLSIADVVARNELAFRAGTDTNTLSIRCATP